LKVILQAADAPVMDLPLSPKDDPLRRRDDLQRARSGRSHCHAVLGSPPPPSGRHWTPSAAVPSPRMNFIFEGDSTGCLRADAVTDLPLSPRDDLVRRRDDLPRAL